MTAVIPVLRLHNDPKYYPKPYRFDTERFNKDEKAKRHRYMYLPFGDVPRVFIGKFADSYIILHRDSIRNRRIIYCGTCTHPTGYVHHLL